jgi:hypothetical protein
MGLFVEHHSDHGIVVQHSGGYPGYGSHMRWHPETGLGVVALANGTYAAPVDTCRLALRALVAGARARPASPAAATPALVAAVTEKLAASGEPFTDELFTVNVALDVPEAERREQLAAARELVGAPTGPAGDVHAVGLGTASWSVPAEHGRYDVEIKVAPTLAPAVQSVKVTAVPHPPAALVTVARRALAGDTEAVAVGADVDADAFVRGVVAATALGGPPRLAGVLAGDGVTTAAFAVIAGTTWWRLEVTGTDPVTALSFTAVPTGDHAALERRFSA